MRKIGSMQVAQFCLLVGGEAALATGFAYFVVMPWFGPDFRGIAAIIGGLLFFYLLAIGIFRLLLALTPIPLGRNIEPGSQADQRVSLYLLHYLLLFNPLIFSRTLPVPLMRLVLRALGATMGENSYSSGIVMDPHLVTMGRNSIIGNSAMLIPHVIEGERMAFHTICIGDGVTIGARAIIMADVAIGDGAMVAVQSVVIKGSRIPPGEIWGGTPAKRLRAAIPDS